MFKSYRSCSNANALKSQGIDPKNKSLSRVDLIIDHSVMVDNYRDNNALKEMLKGMRKQRKI